MNKEIRIYTKTGDDGTTGLIGGTRVKKYDSRLEAYGTIDELNSCIGVVRSFEIDPHAQSVLTTIQEILFVIGAHLASDASAGMIKEQLPCKDEDIEMLEKEMDQMFTVLPR
jgi:cob(I)alamin adenosyltransferase